MIAGLRLAWDCKLGLWCGVGGMPALALRLGPALTLARAGGLVQGLQLALLSSRGPALGSLAAREC